MFCQELVRELGRQNLQVGRRAPVLADAERPGLPEVEAVRRDVVLCAKARFWDVLPGEAERLPVAGVHLAVEQGQPRLPVHRDRGNAQPFEVACHIGLHPFQAGAGLRDPLRRAGPKVIYFDRSMPLLLLAIWFFSIPVNSARDAVKVILGRGNVYLVSLRERERRLIKESWNGRELSK